MGIELSTSDHEKVISILSTMPDFRTEQNRWDFILDVFAGSSRRDDILTRLNLSASPRTAAVHTLDYLARFGQDDPGRETLGVLINKILAYIGGGDNAEFLKTLMRNYPFINPPTAVRGITDSWQGSNSSDFIKEKIIGENTLRDISMLEMALDASKAVARIVTPDSLGTGFLVAPNLLMTNNHVISSEKKSTESKFVFNYQIDKFGNEMETHQYCSKLNGLFYTNHDLDFTVIELEDLNVSHTPLKAKAKRISRDERINIIQHPGGHYKKISFQNNFVAYADNTVVQYTTSTEPGSSGAPVLNNSFEVIAIHHSGGMLIEPNTQRRHLRNAGTSMIAALEDLAKNSPELNSQIRA